MASNTCSHSVYYRKAVPPQEVSPLQPVPPLQHSTTLLEDGKTLFEQDVAIPMRDGVLLYADVYRPDPSLKAKTPTLVLFAPFGKHGAVPRERFQNMGVDFKKLSQHTHWELPDPLPWCGEWGYSFLLVDPRGTWWSEGDASNHISPEEGRDGSTGDIGWGGGVSYYAMSAYQTAVLKPPHLKAIMLWEGISDLYREVNAPGGIPNVPFQHFWMTMTGNGLAVTEDHAVAILEHPLFDEYWQSKVVDWGMIDVPVLAVTGWSSLGLHLRGTIEAWKQMSSPHKYLIIHAGREWSEFYKNENISKQRSFWDRYLQNAANDVDKWPRVELAVRTSATESLRRLELDFPPKAQLIKYRLSADGTLDLNDGNVSNSPPKYASFIAHKSSSVASFDVKIDRRIEITGYSSVKLFIQALSFPDVDLFVALQQIDKDGQTVKFFHSTQKLEADASFGWLRASQRELDTAKSIPERPVHLHQRRLWLRPQDIVEVNVELWPSSTIWEAGDTLRLAVKGTTFTDPEHMTQFKGPSHSFGEVRIWMGGEYKSELLVPEVTASLG
ncbi:unnamed protein product [Clonostachys rhizophaga]|uniref:Xaa-Pro dipeptidyl-peptidase C-terminal domain-containing protein n=1 Tax=Clonostachys rhizophaga TaxID=160324 RepID=A0A9N9YN46_9HYPO|nr:unnamed protein product [Clonostachys rhizophaga]